jgi:hypothetical protein
MGAPPEVIVFLPNYPPFYGHLVATVGDQRIYLNAEDHNIILYDKKAGCVYELSDAHELGEYLDGDN